MKDGVIWICSLLPLSQKVDTAETGPLWVHMTEQSSVNQTGGSIPGLGRPGGSELYVGSRGDP